MKRFWQWVLVAALSIAAPAHANDGPVIAAASDLKFALDEIVATFKRDTGLASHDTGSCIPSKDLIHGRHIQYDSAAVQSRIVIASSRAAGRNR